MRNMEMKEYIKVGLNEPRKIMAFSLSQTRKRDKNRLIKKRTTKTKIERKKNKRKKEKQKKEKKGKREINSLESRENFL